MKRRDLFRDGLPAQRATLTPRLEGRTRAYQRNHLVILAGHRSVGENGPFKGRWTVVLSMRPDVWGLLSKWRLESGINFAADQTETQSQLRKLSRLNCSCWGWRKGSNPLLLKSHPTLLPSEPGASENVT